jgi:hypothetical protein
MVVMACPSQINGASGWVTGLAHVDVGDVPCGALRKVGTDVVSRDHMDAVIDVVS